MSRRRVKIHAATQHLADANANVTRNKQVGEESSARSIPKKMWQLGINTRRALKHPLNAGTIAPIATRLQV